MQSASKFSILLALEIPAIFFSIIIFVYFAANRMARSKFQNHGWLVLVTISFIQIVIDLPMPMSFYYVGRVIPASDLYCVWWTWSEFSLNTIGIFLMAWISVERYIFIFYSHTIFQGRFKKWMYHFIPIGICLCWTPFFYCLVVIISPYCSQTWSFDLIICGVPCYYIKKSVGEFNFLFNVALPVSVIFLVNLLLLIRVNYEKISRHRRINWRNHRKMILQLWIISSIYLICWLPLMITKFVQITVMPTLMVDYLDIILFNVYLVPLFLPMVCLSTLPKLVRKLTRFIHERNRNKVGVTIVIGVHQRIGGER
ncbi:unnamed protein product [Adineta ricciae]|uniref:G-protein coupled receptors family 1 profile domain-containing protein n=1 Tax=Adineta ricciae TaxID=249248 RepID=A0A815G475_ADIRI|nr:unnamed protein product [Adineta ricciae]CAF1400840.1 unnamed protein product [Adineta ricciae]